MAHCSGDIRFGARAGQMVGKKLLLPVSVTNEDFEPLSSLVCQRLNVRSNRAIPLMLHLTEMRLPKFYKNVDVTLRTSRLPDHFTWTLRQLQLEESN
jgi:hypothetical protein